MVTELRFNRLVVMEIYQHPTKRRAYARCICDCGHIAEVQFKRLRTGHTKSCGCLSRERSRLQGEANRRHGQSGKGRRTREYEAWCSMRQRCNYPGSAAYRWYGGRGIKVCERWESFDNFLEDMGIRPAGMSLDRINVNLGYSPENCRWADALTQSRNRRCVRSHSISKEPYELAYGF